MELATGVVHRLAINLFEIELVDSAGGNLEGRSFRYAVLVLFLTLGKLQSIQLKSSPSKRETMKSRFITPHWMHGRYVQTINNSRNSPSLEVRQTPSYSLSFLPECCVYRA